MDNFEYVIYCVMVLIVVLLVSKLNDDDLLKHSETGTNNVITEIE